MDEQVNGGTNAELNEGSVEATESVEEVVNHENDDPIEVLKRQAKDLGINIDDIVMMSKKELESEMDRRVTQAIKTNEERRKKEEERKRMEEEGKYQELLRIERSEALTKQKEALAKAYDLPKEIADMVDIDTLSTMPLSDASKILDERLSTLKNVVDSLVQQRLEMQLKESQRGTATVNGMSATATDSLMLKTQKLLSGR